MRSWGGEPLHRIMPVKMPRKKKKICEKKVQTEERDPDSEIQNLLREEHTFPFLHGAKDFYMPPSKTIEPWICSLEQALLGSICRKWVLK